MSTSSPQEQQGVQADKDRTVVIFGNPSPMMQVDTEDGRRVGQPAKHIQQSETRVEMWPGFDDSEFVERTLSTDNDRVLSMISRQQADEHRIYSIGLSELEQILAVHSSNSKPSWVWSNDPKFAEAISKHFGCPVDRPTALLTNAGRDALHAQHMSTSAQPASFNYMALTASTTAPAATDTVLTGEITTAGGGLLRAQATYAHTAGTNTTTLTKTFTANGSDALPVTLAQIGILNATSVGTLGYHTALNATATLTTSGDNVTITETVQAG